ncbi:hypothetical protein K470DRAFT_206394, partial [Piedraia hortae CBS 480.64]
MRYDGHDERYSYSLHIAQQPLRARMCGYGDKDRRSVTPPPCIQVKINDLRTGLPVNPAEVDGNLFVLMVDLFDETGSNKTNVVQTSGHAASSSHPALSATAPYDYGNGHQPRRLSAARNHPYNPAHTRIAPAATSSYSYSYTAPNAAPTNLFTKNLLGTLTVCANKLRALDGQEGFWFVLQDLSIRTEGTYRLKASFIDLGGPDGILNTGRSPILAWCYSDVLRVYSAKKFPGVIESTALSRCFAEQGVKIPIRKENKN